MALSPTIYSHVKRERIDRQTTACRRVETSVTVFYIALVVAGLIACAQAQNNMDADVIVVGAGVSGLTAAYRLNSLYGKTVLVLEAADRIGGRTWSVPIKGTGGKEYRWDLGGQWVGNTQPHIQELLKELNLETYPQYMDEKGVITRYQDESQMPGTIVGGLDMIQLFGRFEIDVTKVKPNDPFASSSADKWNSKTLADWAKNNSWTKEAREALGLTIAGPMDVDVDNVSALFAMMYLNSAGGSVETFANDYGDGAQAFRIRNGAMSICEALQSQLPPDAVRLNQPVIQVDQSVTDKVTVTTGNGQTYTAEKVIMAIPPIMVNRIDFNPPLNTEKTRLMAGISPKGRAVKAVLTFERPFWREAGLSGAAIILDTKSSNQVKLSKLPEVLTQDAGTHDGGHALIAFVDLTDPEAAALMGDSNRGSQENRKRVLLEQLKKVFTDRVESELIAFDSNYWYKQPFIEGAVATAEPGVLSADYPQQIRAPIDRVHWAGTETGTIWMGYINGAVQAGIRAAAEVAGQEYEPEERYDASRNSGSSKSSGGWLSRLVSIFG